MVGKFEFINDEYLLCGEMSGYLDVIDLLNNKVVNQNKLSQTTYINDILKTSSNELEFALATDNGLTFAQVQIKPSVTIVLDNQLHCKGSDIQFVQEMLPDVFLLCFRFNKYLQTYSRSQSQLLFQIENPSGDCNFCSLTKLLSLIRKSNCIFCFKTRKPFRLLMLKPQAYFNPG